MSKMQNMQLNPYQQEAVLDESNACLVNANVGSGKTTVLIEKIRYLHEEKQIPFSDMCVLTFTNKAAGEIRERLGSCFSKEEQEEMTLFGTFHGVALKLLQEKLPVERLGYREGFQVMTPEEEVEMALKLISENGLRIKYKNRMKKRLDQQGRSDGKTVRYQDDWEKLTELLETEKKKQNKMTYRDLLQNASRLLREEQMPIPLQWIIIDEVQDCDHLQMAFLEQLKKPETHLFAVGDPNQVIYSWRGSVFQIFPLLRMKYQAKELSLPLNYRSTGTILEAARRFLQNGSQLEGCREEGQKIVIRKQYDPFQEADDLSERIRRFHEQGISYGEIGIFYRLQNQSEILEKTLKRNGIPYQVSVKKGIQDIPVLRWLFYVLKAVCYPEDENSLLQAVCDKQYGEGWSQKKASKELEKARGKQKISENLSSLAEQILAAQSYLYPGEENEKECESAAPAKIWIKDLFLQLHLEEHILPVSASYQEDMACVKQMTDSMKENKWYTRKEWCLALREALNQIALSGMRLEEKQEEMADAVKLMTLHASKGLEFSHVFMIGVNYGLIPLHSGGMESEEEERRLFFVGMTRAREYLELSYYTSPDGPHVMPGPSRFLRFLPERLVDAPEDFREQKRSRESAQAHLQEMKKQIEQARQSNETGKASLQSEEKQRETPSEEMGQTGGASCRRKQVRHVKYGIGEILEENEMQIIVEFEDYGKKEFVRQFAPLEFLDED